LLAGLVLGYVELKMPGFGLPGILSIVCFVLLLAGQYLAGLADVPHIVAVALGAALIAVEVFVVPGTLWLGIAGLILVVGGLILGSLGPGFDIGNPVDQDLVVKAATRILVTASVALVIAFTISRFLPKIPVGRRLVLAPSADVAAFAGAMPEASSERAASARPGAMGRAISALRPVGKVVLDSTGAHEWEARSSGALLSAGARVRVVEVSAARLVVEGAQEDVVAEPEARA
jgi:membrane-bound serine protease (ClpP class)